MVLGSIAADILHQHFGSFPFQETGVESHMAITVSVHSARLEFVSNRERVCQRSCIHMSPFYELVGWNRLGCLGASEANKNPAGAGTMDRSYLELVSSADCLVLAFSPLVEPISPYFARGDPLIRRMPGFLAEFCPPCELQPRPVWAILKSRPFL